MAEETPRKVDLKKWVGKVAIITGASAGIGLHLLRTLSVNGIRTVGCARNISKIGDLCVELKSRDISAFKCDVSREDEVRSLFEFAYRKYGTVHILVNNAGLGHNAPLLSGETEHWRNMLGVNVLGLSICTREFYQAQKASGIDSGYIINICSIVGHSVVNSPRNHFYSASKFAVTALTEGTRQELREVKSNIKVSQVSPGLVHTEFHSRLLMDKQKGEEYYQSRLQSLSCIESQNVSEAILYLLSTPPHVCVHDIIIRPIQQAF